MDQHALHRSANLPNLCSIILTLLIFSSQPWRAQAPRFRPSVTTIPAGTESSPVRFLNKVKMPNGQQLPVIIWCTSDFAHTQYAPRLLIDETVMVMPTGEYSVPGEFARTQFGDNLFCGFQMKLRRWNCLEVMEMDDKCVWQNHVPNPYDPGASTSIGASYSHVPLTTPYQVLEYGCPICNIQGDVTDEPLCKYMVDQDGLFLREYDVLTSNFYFMQIERWKEPYSPHLWEMTEYEENYQIRVINDLLHPVNIVHHGPQRPVRIPGKELEAPAPIVVESTSRDSSLDLESTLGNPHFDLESSSGDSELEILEPDPPEIIVLSSDSHSDEDMDDVVPRAPAANSRPLPAIHARVPPAADEVPAPMYPKVFKWETNLKWRPADTMGVWIVNIMVEGTGMRRDNVRIWASPSIGSPQPNPNCFDCEWKLDDNGIWLDKRTCRHRGPIYEMKYEWQGAWGWMWG